MNEERSEEIVLYQYGGMGKLPSLSPPCLKVDLALRILGRPDAETIFADRPFPSRWWYRGRPWFLPAYTARMNWLDRRTP